jgi:hypothetical protein
MVRDFDVRYINFGGAWALMSNWSGADRTTGTTFDATELPFWTLYGQNLTPDWVANTLYPSGFKVRQNEQTWERISNGASGANFDPASWKLLGNNSRHTGMFTANAGAWVTLPGWTIRLAMSTGVAATSTTRNFLISSNTGADIAQVGWFVTYVGGSNAEWTNPTVLTTGSNRLVMGVGLTSDRDAVMLCVRDVTNSRAYRAYMGVGPSYTNNEYFLEEIPF